MADQRQYHYPYNQSSEAHQLFRPSNQSNIIQSTLRPDDLSIGPQSAQSLIHPSYPPAPSAHTQDGYAVDSYYENTSPNDASYNDADHANGQPWDQHSRKSYDTHHSEAPLHPQHQYEMAQVQDRPPPLPTLQYQQPPPPPQQEYYPPKIGFAGRPPMSPQNSSWTATKEKVMRRRVRTSASIQAC
jgi:hypothetical protein